MDEKLPRGVFIRNGEHWIRYTDQNGKLPREHVGPFLEPAKRAIEKRRSEVREGKFFPEKIKQRVVLFGEIAKDYLKTRKIKRDFNHDEDRVELLLDGRKPKKSQIKTTDPSPSYRTSCRRERGERFEKRAHF